MSIFNLLAENKGAVSTSLAKELAQKVLSENSELLIEAIELTTIKGKGKETKNIRAGASKIVELVAEKKPDMVANFLEKLLPALAVAEPQTRWAILRTMGFCAHLNKEIAEKAIQYSEQFLLNKEGLCLSSSADLFLGDYGATSFENAQRVFPLLKNSTKNMLLNEQDWLLVAFHKIYPLLDDEQKNGHLNLLGAIPIHLGKVPKKEPIRF